MIRVALIAMAVSGATRAADLPLRYLALGDSYTIGESVPESGRWPVQLADRLRAHGLDFSAPQIIARTGWTTDELAEAIVAADPQGPYELVSLLIGVNNQYRGRSAEDYRAQLTGLLQTAVRLAGDRPEHVLVLSIPDWGVTPFAANSGRDVSEIAVQINRFNAIARWETSVVGAHWVDITDLTREATSRPELLATDGLHPSALDYARWADRAFAAMVPVLAARTTD